MDISKIKEWQIAGFFFASVVGTLLHFVYEWTDFNLLSGFFSAVNESTWEHVKLLLVPVILFTIIEYFAYGRYSPCFLPVKLISAVLGALVIIAGYYTYTGALGVNIETVNIILFFAGAFAVYRYSYVKLTNGDGCSRFASFLAALALIALIAAIPLLTLNPPKVPLFRDPLSGLYGIYR
jgi:CDP-diglyceride synthetase